jgi:DinB superfamily
MDEEKLREQLVSSLSGRGAHAPFEKVVDGFPVELAGKPVAGLPHTAWQLLHHLWIAQWDILEFIRDPSHESPPWPEGYWPKEPAPADASDWQATVKKFRSDLSSIIGLVRDTKNDLLSPIPHGDGQTLLREALLVIDHNSYHLGQLVDIRRGLHAWPK